MIHELKIEKPYFEAIVSGDKTFEIIYNDMGYNKGDIVVFIEVSNYHQKENWVVFGIKDI